MWIDEHPYAFIYLLGSAVAVMLALFNSLLFWVLAWLTKSNVIAANLLKVATPPDARSGFQKIGAFLGMLAFEAACSWVSVAIAVVVVPYRLLKMLREVFSTAPQSVQELRFPLKNNPLCLARPFGHTCVPSV